MTRLVMTAATGFVAVLLVSPAGAGTTQISGVGTPVPSCAGRTSDFTIAMAGSLVGCWYATVAESKFNPSGTYQERGSETFVGCLNGTTCGTFTTDYTFTAKYVDETLARELHGRCEHTIVSGTGGFAGAKGLLNFKDDVDAGIFLYRGHIA